MSFRSISDPHPYSQGVDRIPTELHDRQEAAHAHCIMAHPSNRWVVACDLGLSTVFVYGLDEQAGALRGAADDPRHLRADAAAGCRHCCWDASGTTLFIHNELECSVTAASFDAVTGQLTARHTMDQSPRRQ